LIAAAHLIQEYKQFHSDAQDGGCKDLSTLFLLAIARYFFYTEAP